MAVLSMALVVGLVGIVNTSTMGSNTTDIPSQASNAAADVNHNNVSNVGAEQGTTPKATQVQPSQTDQTSPSQTDINTPMKSSDVSMNNQIQNMPVNTQIQTMPMSTPMNGQISNSQNQQEMSGTHRASGNTIMGSTGRMGR